MTLKLPKLNNESYKPLYIQLSDILINYIRSNNFSAGELLPSENELLAIYSVSRNTIRLAIDRLVQLNLATKVRGKGTFVKDNTSKKPIRGFFYDVEDSLRDLGWEFVNEVIEAGEISQPPDWSKSIGDFAEEKMFYICRTKKSGNDFLAIEERLIPCSVGKRLTVEQIREKSIYSLVDQFPEYEVKQTKYILHASNLDTKEKEILNHPPIDNALRRMGDYIGITGNRIMTSRQTVLKKEIEFQFNFQKDNDAWNIFL